MFEKIVLKSVLMNICHFVSQDILANLEMLIRKVFKINLTTKKGVFLDCTPLNNLVLRILNSKYKTIL